MEERLSKLEDRIDAISKSLQTIEARLSALERNSTGVSWKTAPALPDGEPHPEEPGTALSVHLPVAGLISLVGQTCLVLCGAFLLRALTDMEILPPKLGFLLGFGYAVGWLAFTDYSARAGRILAANFYGAASAMIAYPLLWEASTKQQFAVLSGFGPAAALGVLTLLALFVAWRRNLRVLAWVVTLLALTTSLPLIVATHSMEPYALVLLLLGGVTVWFSYSRGWQVLPWPVAAAVNLVVLVMTWFASKPGGIPENYCNMSIPAVMALALALLFVYLASFAVQTLLRKQDVSAFEMIQTAAALIVGFGGAVHVAVAAESGVAALGGVAMVLAVACYGVAFAFTELRWEHRRNFMFYAWLALILTLSGCYLVAEGLPLTLYCCVLGIVAALLGVRFSRVTLQYHSAVYVCAAALTAGLAGFSLDVFTSSDARPWSPLTAASLVVLATAGISYVTFASTRIDPGRPWSSRIPRVAVAVVALVGSGAVMILIMLRAVGSEPPDSDAALVAATRSVVLACSAVALAAAGRRQEFLELRWLVYPILVVAGIKLMLEDLPSGRPVTLFIAFAFYGIGLLLAPRLVRKGQQAS